MLSKKSQLQRAAYDALGLCAFNTSATGQQPEVVLNMLRAVFDVDLPENWLDILGRKVIDMELAFNKAAGLTAADNRIPEYFHTEKLSEPSESVFDVPDSELDSIWDS